MRWRTIKSMSMSMIYNGRRIDYTDLIVTRPIKFRYGPDKTTKIDLI